MRSSGYFLQLQKHQRIRSSGRNSGSHCTCRGLAGHSTRRRWCRSCCSRTGTHSCTLRLRPGCSTLRAKKRSREKAMLVRIFFLVFFLCVCVFFYFYEEFILFLLFLFALERYGCMAPSPSMLFWKVFVEKNNQLYYLPHQANLNVLWLFNSIKHQFHF